MLQSSKTYQPTVTRLEPQPLGKLSALPLASILLTNYNYASYVAASIESVLNQSYANWELVICDDGSTDESLGIIHAYADNEPRIKLVCQANGGHTAALNKAYELSSGQIICFLDSDDLFLPEKVASVVDAYLNHPNTGFVIHRVIRVDANRNRKGVWPLSEQPDGWLGEDLLKTGGILQYAPPTSGISLRRDIAALLFPISIAPPLNVCPDQVVTRLAPLVSLVRRLPKALAEFRVHDANAYSNNDISAQKISRQIAISKALWNEQRQFLDRLDPVLAGQLEPLDNNSFSALLQYLEAKLSGHSTVRECYGKLMSLRKEMGESKLSTFWKLSIYLPNFLFRPLLGFVTGQGFAKELIARFRKLA